MGVLALLPNPPRAPCGGGQCQGRHGEQVSFLPSRLSLPAHGGALARAQCDDCQLEESSLHTVSSPLPSFPLREADPVPLPVLSDLTDAFPASLPTPLPDHPLLKGTAHFHHLAPPTPLPVIHWPASCCQGGLGCRKLSVAFALPPLSVPSPSPGLFLVCSMSWCLLPLKLDLLSTHPFGVTTTGASGPHVLPGSHLPLSPLGPPSCSRPSWPLIPRKSKPEFLACYSGLSTKLLLPASLVLLPACCLSQAF